MARTVSFYEEKIKVIVQKQRILKAAPLPREQPVVWSRGRPGIATTLSMAYLKQKWIRSHWRTQFCETTMRVLLK